MNITQHARKTAASIVDCIRMALLRRISTLRKKTIGLMYGNLRITARSTFSVINGIPVDNTQYDKNNQAIKRINKKMQPYIRLEFHLMYLYFELIGKPLRRPDALKKFV